MASPTPTYSPIDVILDFKTLDQNRDGAITAVEFVDGLRSNPQLALKFGLADDVLNAKETREKYDLKFRTIDYNHSDIVNVMPFHLCTTLCHEFLASYFILRFKSILL